MQITYRQSGIIIASSTGQSMPSDTRKALEAALKALKEHRPRLQVASWDWTDRVQPKSAPDEVRTAKQPELLRVIAGAGSIISDGLEDGVDYGYWAFIPKGVTDRLRGGMMSGMNFRVVTVPLK